jgi:hypothetical protein
VRFQNAAGISEIVIAIKEGFGPRAKNASQSNSDPRIKRTGCRDEGANRQQGLVSC